MTERRPVHIYSLTDPRTGEVRYIGQSIRPRERLTNHFHDKCRTYRTHWLAELRSLGLRPALEILETVTAAADWRERERWWIAEGRRHGWPLTNCTSGGDGTPDLPPEARARIVSAWLGRKHRPETIELYRKIRKGKRHTEAHKVRMSGLMKGRQITWVDKIRVANSKLNADQIAAIRSLLAQKVSQYVIADRFGVHQGTISNIKLGKFYADM